jgi:hypothetical protein
MSDPDSIFYCPGCDEFHLNCFGCNKSIAIPWIVQRYILTYQEFLTDSKVTQNQTDWQKGFSAGQNRQPNQPPPGVDPLSWASGYIEGKAAHCTPTH